MSLDQLTEKIKVCFVQSFGYSVFNPDSSARIGGAEVDLFNISTELAQDENFDVYFLVADFGQDEIETYQNVKVIKGHSQSKSIKNYIFSFVDFYKKLRQINADIYLTANLSKFVGLTNFYCKLFHKIHVHRTEHEVQVTKPLIFKRMKKNPIKYLLFYLGFINVNHIIVQNKEHKQILKKTYHFPSNVIKNSYPIRKIVNSKRDFILWVARGENWKQPELFIDLAKDFPNEKFTMIMPKGSDSNYFKKISTKANKLANLKFIPGIPFSEIGDYYKNAKVFVNTSRFEGFPNSFNQSMNSSTPLLSLNVNPDKFIDVNNVGIFCNNNYGELKKGLELILQNEELWKEFSENAFEYVHREMNIKKAIRKWKHIFKYLYYES